MNAVIVDTNVIVIANGDAQHATADCIERCQDRLEQISNHHEIVVVDDRWRILGEYNRHTDPNSRKWIGDMFVKMLLRYQKNPNVCTMVHITSLAGNGTDFEEFPTDNALCSFDPDDRKFIAVALAYQSDARQVTTILLAIDRGWFQFTKVLANHGVNVDIICEDNT